MCSRCKHGEWSNAFKERSISTVPAGVAPGTSNALAVGCRARHKKLNAVRNLTTENYAKMLILLQVAANLLNAVLTLVHIRITFIKNLLIHK